MTAVVTLARNISNHHRVGRAIALPAQQLRGDLMNGLIYLIGLIVVIMAVLSLFGLR
jgi:hypothetical protein